MIEAPCYVVIFTSVLQPEHAGYESAAAAMEALAETQPGFLGLTSVRSGNLGISVSYWTDEAAISRWKADAEHLLAQESGRRRWYLSYQVQVARIERAYAFDGAPLRAE